MPASKADSPKATPTGKSPENTGEKATPAPHSLTWHWRSALAGGLISATLLGGGVLVVRQPNPPEITIHPPPPAGAPALTAADNAPAPTTAADITPDATPAPLVVFVSGAVAAPGVYEVPPNARVLDALQAAGGLTAAANPAAVNQAEPLQDGDQIHIPTQVELPAEPPAGIINAPVTGNTTTDGDALQVNINTATQAELEQLPGIGPSRAADIIAGRPYATIDDLDRVPGIGEATLNQLRPHIIVQ